MKRTLVVFALVACSKDREASHETPPAPPPPAVVPVDATVAAIPDAEAETSNAPDLVAAAFGGHAPVLPALAPDGALVAIDLSQGLGMSSASTYEVGIMKLDGTVTDHFVVVDHALAEHVARGLPATAVPKRRLAALCCHARSVSSSSLAGRVGTRTRAGKTRPDESPHIGPRY